MTEFRSARRRPAAGGRLLVVVACLWWAPPASAHRLDEYLQASRISLDPAGLAVEIDLTPGASVADRVIARVDEDGDGVLSPNEQNVYAAMVLRDATLEIDGRRAELTLVDGRFPTSTAMREGTGAIQLRARGPAISTSGRHAVRFLNRHEPEMSVYLVNALMPPAGITITGQRRDYWQHQITIDYAGEGAAATAWTLAAALVLIGIGGLTIYRVSSSPAPASSAPSTHR
jgi:hypothetical protein